MDFEQNFLNNSFADFFFADLFFADKLFVNVSQVEHSSDSGLQALPVWGYQKFFVYLNIE